MGPQSSSAVNRVSAVVVVVVVTRRGSASHPPTDRPHLQQRVFLLCGEAASVTVRLGRRQLMWPVDVSDCSLYGQTPSRTGRSFTAVTSPRERLAAARSSRKQAGGRPQEAAPSRLQSKGGKGGKQKGEVEVLEFSWDCWSLNAFYD